MEEVANDRGPEAPELPTRERRPGQEQARTGYAEQPVPTPMSVGTMLTLPAFSGAELVAGEAGLERLVRRANVMEVPDIVAWVRPEALLLTTGYPLRELGTGLAELVAELDDRGVSALAVKLHRYLYTLPAGMLAEADARGLPLIVVPDTVGFDEVLTQVFTNVVSERASLLERGEEVHRHLVDIVLSGGGLPEVAQSVADLFGGVAMVTTTDGRVLSEAGETGLLSAVTASAAFHPSGRFRTEVSTVGVHRAEELPGSHAVVAVRGGRIDHGRLVVFQPTRLMTRADLAVLERAATVAAICLTKEIAITAVESKYRGDFLRDVLAGRAGTAEEVLRHARTLGWELDRRVVVVAAALETEQGPPLTLGYQGPVELERFTAAWRTVVSGNDPSVPVVGFASEVVALLPLAPGASPADVVDAALKGVAGDGGGGRRPFATGVSRPAAGVADLPAAYEQARKALRVGRQLHGPRAASYFEDLGVFRLLSLIEDSEELDGFVRETLGELAEPTEEAADLRRTLQVLLDTNLNIAQTARRLHFHYNTLRYRIGKLERLVGPFASDPHVRLDLALALRIVGMRGV